MNKLLKIREHGFALFGLIMVVATISLVGIVAFRFLDAQDNTQVATDNTQTTSQVATIKSSSDIDKVTKQLDTAELDAIDAELDSEFNF